MRVSGRKPTRRQRNFIEGKRLNSDNWLVVRNLPDLMELVHRHTFNRRIIKKGGEIEC